MHKSELLRKIDEIIAMEDSFVESLAAIDMTNVKHSHFPVISFLRLKSGLTKLLDDSRRHKEIISDMRTILSGDMRDEY